MLIQCTCRKCGKTFHRWPSRAAQYCSVTCCNSKRRLPAPDIEISEDGLTALIPLHAANGSIRAYAIIDADDVPLIDQRRWVLHPDGYAQSKIDGVRQLMHRRLLGLVVGDFRKIDHINRNRLDNRRVNLRIVTDSGNAQNRTPQHKTSSFRGVVWHKTLKKWMAQAKVNQKNYYLGLFTDEREAAEAARAFRASHMPFSTD